MTVQDGMERSRSRGGDADLGAATCIAASRSWCLPARIVR